MIIEISVSLLTHETLDAEILNNTSLGVEISFDYKSVAEVEK